jgi:hypothetical protein
MKRLSPIWFLKSPIDVEYKYYILLNFLQSVNLEIKSSKIYSPVKRIFSIIKELEHFKKYESILITDYSLMEDEDVEVLDSYSDKIFSAEEKSELDQIIKNSLIILYKYADLGINLWKNIENRIKIFNLVIEEAQKNNGITIFRNMSTNEVFSYWWKKTEIKLGKEIKSGVVLKKIPILNNYYSMSYEYIVHETLDSMGIRNGSKYTCTIIEISEDFDLNSEIFKIAKEKFIQEIDGMD